MESASKEGQPVQETVDYCKNSKHNIQLFTVKSTDRFTRGGSYFYDHLEMQYTRYGVQLVTIFTSLSAASRLTPLTFGCCVLMERIFSNNESSDLESERANDEIRDILSRMIGAQSAMFVWDAELLSRWTDGKSIEGQFPGLMSYDAFNKAHRDKIVISEVKVEKRQPADWS